MFPFFKQVCETISNLKARAEGLLDRHQIYLKERERSADIISSSSMPDHANKNLNKSNILLECLFFIHE